MFTSEAKFGQESSSMESGTEDLNGNQLVNPLLNLSSGHELVLYM